MFSAIEPLNSQVSWSTIPVLERSSSLVIDGHVDTVKCDPPGLDLVKAHKQVDQSGLACPGGADDCHRLPRVDGQGQVFDERLVREVGKGNVVKCDPPLHHGEGGGIRLGPALVRRRRGGRKRARRRPPLIAAGWPCSPPGRWAG